ncbi:arsenate reductase ArsC [Pseudomonas sp. GX19020]|uniref:arsenate reductase ArsC n=1 Tax=Pseudomonas sp. GX19020 TaxID=2942277 RepID=UPI002019E92F|nr:arsenate reductase ArsC [Pseudomonas sp. GX19020]MCL4067408.1 arsenate reductase ArsC [Pseudomonas sp. GX19020]
MTQRVYNVLFLCTGNSARSIIAEAVLRKLGEGRFNAYSAGSFPKPDVNPTTLKILENFHYPTEGLRSKSWDEFAMEGAPQFDFVITVCDDAAGEVCPLWPGTPATAHWGIADPAAATDTELEREMAFIEALRYLTLRLELFCELPMASLDAMSLNSHLREIGRAEGATDQARDRR